MAESSPVSHRERKVGYILTSGVNNDFFSVWPQMNGFKRLAKNGIFGIWLETLRGVNPL